MRPRTRLTFNQRRLLLWVLPTILFVHILYSYLTRAREAVYLVGVGRGGLAAPELWPEPEFAADDDIEADDPGADNRNDDTNGRVYEERGTHLQQLLAPPEFDGEHTLKYLNYKWYSEQTLRQLTACTMAFYLQYHGGEGVWCHGLQNSMQRQGYTVLHAGSGDWPYVAGLHRQLGDMVKVIFVEVERTEHGNIEEFYGNGFPRCKLGGTSPICGVRDDTPQVFNFEYVPHDNPTVIGMPWRVIAEPERYEADEPGFMSRPHVLGYALEPVAFETESVSLADRPMRVFILAKRVQYFYSLWAPAWFPRDMITKALRELRTEFPDLELSYPCAVPLLLGIGWLTDSPSQARGVPFLNPHRYDAHRGRFGDQDDDHGTGSEDEHRTWRFVQHFALQRTPEPYVYNVKAHDYNAFVAAIRAALTTEIGPYRFGRMERDAVDRRVAAFIEADWKGEAQRRGVAL